MINALEGTRPADHTYHAAIGGGAAATSGAGRGATAASRAPPSKVGARACNDVLLRRRILHVQGPLASSLLASGSSRATFSQARVSHRSTARYRKPWALRELGRIPCSLFRSGQYPCPGPTSLLQSRAVAVDLGGNASAERHHGPMRGSGGRGCGSPAVAGAPGRRRTTVPQRTAGAARVAVSEARAA